MTMRTTHLSFTFMYLLLLVLDPGGGAVGDPFLTIGLPIIAVAVLAVPTVLVSMLLTLFYRRFVFVEYMLCLGYFTHSLSPHSQVIIVNAYSQVIVNVYSHPLLGDQEANRRRRVAWLHSHHFNLLLYHPVY